MQIVIDIPEEVYKDTIEFRTLFDEYMEDIRNAVKNGVLLPKGHGRLIDADDIDNHIIGHVDTRSCPTIIEAESEVQDADCN